MSVLENEFNYSTNPSSYYEDGAEISYAVVNKTTDKSLTETYTKKIIKPVAREEESAPISGKRGRPKKASAADSSSIPDLVEDNQSSEKENSAGEDGSGNSLVVDPAAPSTKSFTLKRQPQGQQQAAPPQPDAFNVEFDGVIIGEGVLEMMPDGYGFLRSSDEN
ncbi:MAG: hypothetical protein ACK42F_02260, partial [Sphingobacteriales bacterium]